MYIFTPVELLARVMAKCVQTSSSASTPVEIYPLLYQPEPEPMAYCHSPLRQSNEKECSFRIKVSGVPVVASQSVDLTHACMVNEVVTPPSDSPAVEFGAMRYWSVEP